MGSLALHRLSSWTHHYSTSFEIQSIPHKFQCHRISLGNPICIEKGKDRNMLYNYRYVTHAC